MAQGRQVMDFQRALGLLAYPANLALVSVAGEDFLADDGPFGAVVQRCDEYTLFCQRLDTGRHERQPEAFRLQQLLRQVDFAPAERFVRAVVDAAVGVGLHVDEDFFGGALVVRAVHSLADGELFHLHAGGGNGVVVEFGGAGQGQAWLPIQRCDEVGVGGVEVDRAFVDKAGCAGPVYCAQHAALGAFDDDVVGQRGAQGYRLRGVAVADPSKRVATLVDDAFIRQSREEIANLGEGAEGFIVRKR